MIEPGIYPDMENKDYHMGPGVSKSTLDRVAKSPSHVWVKTKQTPAMAFGSAVHAAILENDKFLNDYIACPYVDKRKKDYKEWAHENQDKIVLSAIEYRQIENIANSVYQIPMVRDILSDGVAEQAHYWTDEKTGLLCKCKPDWLHPSRICMDLKTTTDARPNKFKWSVRDYRYHVQEAFYTDGLAATDTPIDEWIFLVVEKTAPYLVSLIQLTDDSVKQGRKLYEKDLQTYKMCKATDEWPGLTQEITTIDIPSMEIMEENNE